jgi:hypothetical protein
MAFEGGVDMIWVIIISLAVTASIIAFFVYFRPSVETGPLSYLASAVSWFLKPVIP